MDWGSLTGVRKSRTIDPPNFRIFFTIYTILESPTGNCHTLTHPMSPGYFTVHCIIGSRLSHGLTVTERTRNVDNTKGYFISNNTG